MGESRVKARVEREQSWQSACVGFVGTAACAGFTWRALGKRNGNERLAQDGRSLAKSWWHRLTPVNARSRAVIPPVTGTNR